VSGGALEAIHSLHRECEAPKFSEETNYRKQLTLERCGFKRKKNQEESGEKKKK